MNRNRFLSLGLVVDISLNPDAQVNEVLDVLVPKQLALSTLGQVDVNLEEVWEILGDFMYIPSSLPRALVDPVRGLLYPFAQWVLVVKVSRDQARAKQLGEEFMTVVSQLRDYLWQAVELQALAA